MSGIMDEITKPLFDDEDDPEGDDPEGDGA
jgi:hypothetical protein